MKVGDGWEATRHLGLLFDCLRSLVFVSLSNWSVTSSVTNVYELSRYWIHYMHNWDFLVDVMMMFRVWVSYFL